MDELPRHTIVVIVFFANIKNFNLHSCRVAWHQVFKDAVSDVYAPTKWGLLSQIIGGFRIINLTLLRYFFRLLRTHSNLFYSALPSQCVAKKARRICTE